MAFTGWPVTVSAPGAVVVLRGLTIDGGVQVGNGIAVTSIGNLHIESCVITGFSGRANNGNGIVISTTAASGLFIKDTLIRGNQYVGLFVGPASGSVQASVDHCRFEQNFGGVVSSGFAQVTMTDSVVSGNASWALVAQIGGELTAEACVISNNQTGLTSAGTGTIRASNCTITDNVTGLSARPNGAILSRSNNTVEGNGTDGSFTGTYSAK